MLEEFEQVRTTLRQPGWRVHPEAVLLTGVVFDFQGELISLFCQCLVECYKPHDDALLREQIIKHVLARIRSESLGQPPGSTSRGIDNLVSRIVNLIGDGNNIKILGLLGRSIRNADDSDLRSLCKEYDRSNVRKEVGLNTSDMWRAISSLVENGLIFAAGDRIRLRVLVPLFYQLPD